MSNFFYFFIIYYTGRPGYLFDSIVFVGHKNGLDDPDPAGSVIWLASWIRIRKKKSGSRIPGSVTHDYGSPNSDPNEIFSDS